MANIRLLSFSVLLVFIAAASWAEDLVLNDLGTHTLSTVESRRIMLAGNQTFPLSSGPVTTLEVVPGGDAAGGVTTDRLGRLRVLGGTVSGFVEASSMIQLSRGMNMEMTDGSFLDASAGEGSVSISGGTGRLLEIGYDYPYGGGQLTMTGGILQQFHPHSGRANLIGGRVNWLKQEPGSQVTISGANVGSVSLVTPAGAFPPELFVTGGSVGPISGLGGPSCHVTISGGHVSSPINQITVLEIRGTEFSVPFGDYRSPTFSHITGVLGDGNALDLSFSMTGTSPLLRVVQVPEAVVVLYLLPGAYLLARRRVSRTG